MQISLHVSKEIDRRLRNIKLKRNKSLEWPPPTLIAQKTSLDFSETKLSLEESEEW